MIITLFPGRLDPETPQLVTRPCVLVQEVFKYAGQVLSADSIRNGNPLVPAACADSEAIDDPTLAFTNDLDPETTIDIETLTFARHTVHLDKLARRLLPSAELDWSERRR
jgi:hypothetical protein